MIKWELITSSKAGLKDETFRGVFKTKKEAQWKHIDLYTSADDKSKYNWVRISKIETATKKLTEEQIEELENELKWLVDDYNNSDSYARTKISNRIKYINKKLNGTQND